MLMASSTLETDLLIGAAFGCVAGLLAVVALDDCPSWFSAVVGESEFDAIFDGFVVGCDDSLGDKKLVLTCSAK